MLVAVLAASALVLVRSRDDGSPSASATGGEIFLEAADKPGADPFTTSVAGEVFTPKPVAFPTTSTTTSAPTPQTPVLSTAATEPGLYGGTRDNASCDAAQMATFLEQNPGKAAAWATVEGIPTADVRTFLMSLTPVLLRVDTRVTNHGFANGQATGRQAILQAGTAVLVDATGMPRAKCGCGNPLAAPEPVKTTPAYTGPPWNGFTPAQVVVVAPGPPVESFVLVDPRSEQPFVRPAGSHGDADTDAPPGTDVSNPLGAATVSAPTTSTVPSTASSTAGATHVGGTVALRPGIAEQLAAQGQDFTQVASDIQLDLSGDGTATGRFTVTFRVADAGCVYRSEISGELVDSTADAALSGSWQGAFAEAVDSGDCSSVTLLNQASTGTWDATVDPGTGAATGGITVEGSRLLGFEARR